MRKNKSPYQVMMEEVAADKSLWDRDTHIKGCFAGYQHEAEFGTAVYFALEMLWGIAVHGKQLEKEGLTEDLRGPDGTLRADAEFEVPWFCIVYLAVAWDSYKEKGPPLGKAFGLEGPRGKRPVLARLDRMQDQRAFARFVWQSAEVERARGVKDPVARAIGEVANKFDVSDETVTRAWKRFGKAERELHQG